MSKNQPSSNKRKQRISDPSQHGGAGSSYSHFWYSTVPSDVQVLSRYTADHLYNTPMFNPLKQDTKVATPTSGLIPTGVHLGNRPAPMNYYQLSRPLYLVGGGVGSNGEQRSTRENNWVQFSKNYAQKNQMTYKEAISSQHCQRLYHQSGGK